MKNKKSTVLFAVFAVILFILGAVTTAVAIKSGNDYKGTVAAYNLYQKSAIDLGTAKLTAQTDSAKDRADEYKNNFKKYFAISVLLYVALIVMLVLIYLNTVKAKEFEEENKKQE